MGFFFFTVFKLELTVNTLCEVALPVDLLCINYSAIKKWSLYCKQLPGVLKPQTGARTFPSDAVNVPVAQQTHFQMYAHSQKLKSWNGKTFIMFKKQGGNPPAGKTPDICGITAKI